MTLATLKAWAVPLLRTFLAGFLAAVVAGLASVTSVPAAWPVITGAAVAGLNAVILAVQHLLPGVPNPVPPPAPSTQPGPTPQGTLP